MKESIVVCVVYGEHGVRLLDRAIDLARNAHAQLTLVVLDPRSDDFDGDRLLDIPLYRTHVERAGGEMRHVRRSTHEIVSVLADISREVGATQLVLAERPPSLWDMLFEPNFVQSLLHAVPSAELHLMSAESAADDYVWDHEPAISSYLRPRSSDDAVIRFDDAPAGSLEGLFCRRVDTDFTSGLFLFQQGGHIHGLEVEDGHIDLDTLPFDWSAEGDLSRIDVDRERQE